MKPSLTVGLVPRTVSRLIATDNYPCLAIPPIQNFIADPAKLKRRVLQACRDSVSRFPLDERSAKINPLFSAVPVLVNDRDYLHPRLCAL